MKNNSGQTLYYFLVFIMILVISWAMVLNIAKLIRDRMIMQSKADNIALSIAVHKARTMNFVGACNYLIGSILAIGTKPEIVQIPTLSTKGVAAFPFGDYKGNSTNKALDKDVAMMKSVVDGLQTAQETAMISHLLYHDALMVEYLSDPDYKLIIYPTAVPTKSNAEKYFGLKRNKKGITYLKTVNTEPRPYPHIVYNPFPLKDITDLITEKLSGAVISVMEKLGMDPENIIKNALNLSSGFMKEKVYKKSDYSWYITDENFSDQKVQVVLLKPAKDKNRPLFSKLLKIKYPTMAAFSAASIYNVDGTMFPSKESDLIGKPDTEVLLAATTTAQSAIFIAQMVTKDSTPYKILSILTGAYVTIRVVIRFASVKEDAATSPINAYNKAKFGGWAAHLIPYKSASDN
ncbi:MAG: hypothetical protein LBV66_03510 [Elusimicrobiota bacterium]|jgi:hypothetical protein|nr:hypothetical protein [Elusimicrobiota bacterium]